MAVYWLVLLHETTNNMHSHYIYSALKNDHWLATSVCVSFCISTFWTHAARKSFFELVKTRPSRALQYYMSLTAGGGQQQHNESSGPWGARKRKRRNIGGNGKYEGTEGIGIGWLWKNRKRKKPKMERKTEWLLKGLIFKPTETRWRNWTHTHTHTHTNLTNKESNLHVPKSGSRSANI